MKENKWYRHAKTWKEAQKKAEQMRQSGGVAIIKKIYAGKPYQSYSIEGHPKGLKRKLP